MDQSNKLNRWRGWLQRLVRHCGFKRQVSNAQSRTPQLLEFVNVRGHRMQWKRLDTPDRLGHQYELVRLGEEPKRYGASHLVGSGPDTRDSPETQGGP